MDKRSLLFFVLITTSFMMVNHYFSSKNTAEKVTTHLSEQRREELQNDLAAKAENYSLRIKDFGVNPLYYSPEKEVVAYAVDVQGQELTFSWGYDLPKELYSGKRQVKLTKAPDSLGEPILYRKNSTKLQLPDFQNDDNSEYFLLTLGKEPKVCLAKTVDSELIMSEKLSQNAIAFIKGYQGFSPVAIYDAASKKLRSIKHYPILQNEIEYQTVDIPKESAQEKHYVLENDYQMLVFSTKGGALTEINLPFQTKTNTKSVVKEIQFDRTLEKRHPDNDTFPQGSFSIMRNGREQFYDKGELGGYYPLLRRSIVYPNGDVLRISPKNYALSVVGDGSENRTYKLSRFTDSMIEFTSSEPHRRITKRFSLPDDPDKAPYIFNVDIKVEGDARGLWINSGVPDVELISGSFSPALKYRVTRGDKGQIEKVSLPKEKAGKEQLLVTTVNPDWVANSNGFLGMIIDPLSSIPAGFEAQVVSGKDAPTRLSLIDSRYDLYPVSKYPGYEMMLPLKGGEELSFRVFAGPFQTSILKAIDTNFDEQGYNPDYIGAQSFHGWFSFISEPFAKFLFMLMQLFHSITSSWGLSIILLTVVLRLMLYPLNAWSIRSTSRMQEIAPEVKKLQEKYKKDPKRAQLEIMKLYKEKGANPFMGCFPILIQMPFLIGMFDLLKSTFELRGASFIPGWINNLTEPDVLFSWSYPIFFIGTQFHLLPILLGAVMLAQQKVTAYLSGNKGNEPLTDQQRQQKMMGNVMVVVFTVLFYHFPSGLNIYWLSSMLLGIGQQYLMKKRMTKPATTSVKLKRHK